MMLSRPTVLEIKYTPSAIACDERGTSIPTIPAAWNRDKLLKLSDSHLVIADAMGRSEWENRSEKSILSLEQYAATPLMLDVQQRRMF
jgi:hypothetical protein